jgi:hypothetical protein
MRALLFYVAVCTASLSGCKKDDKPAAGSAPAPTTPIEGSAADRDGAGVTGQGRVDRALEAAGSAAALAGKAAELAGEAAEKAGSAAQAAATAAAIASIAAPRPASVTDKHVAVAEKLIGSVTRMGATLTAAGSDCKKAADAIRASASEMQALKGEVEGLTKLGERDAAAKAWFETNYAAKMMGALGPIMQVAQTCATDPGFNKAMEELDLGN